MYAVALTQLCGIIVCLAEDAAMVEEVKEDEQKELEKDRVDRVAAAESREGFEEGVELFWKE
jgi:hypothetical protein